MTPTQEQRRARAAAVATGVALAALGGAAVVSAGWSSADPAAGDRAASQSAERTAAPAAAVPPADRCARTKRRTVLVDLSDQQLWLCRGGVTEATSPVTTGRKGDRTPTGSWTVYADQTDRWLSGPGYVRRVDYWMPFYEGYGFHDSSWQTIPYGGQQFHAEGSRGCVHVPRAMMKRLHRWGDVGTKVRIVR